MASGSEGSDPLTSWTPDVVAEVLSEARQHRRTRRVFKVTPGRWAFRKAASVLASFDPSKLRPFRTPDEPGSSEDKAETPEDKPRTASEDQIGSALENLVADCVATPGRQDGVRWSLKDDVRRGALRKLATHKTMLAALAINESIIDEEDPVQRLIGEYLRGETPPLDRADVAELSAMLQVSGWLHGFVPGVPDPPEVRRVLEERRLYRPFQVLAGHHFAGRKGELARLREYIGVLPPSRARDVMSRAVRKRIGRKRQPALAVHGPGGIGKSTLIARFMLDHVTQKHEREISFVHLDFADPHLDAGDWQTWIAAALVQLKIQHRLSGSSGERFELVTSKIEELLAETGLRARSRLDPKVAELLAELALVATPGKEGDSEDAPPFLVVLDSFEEVQHQGEAILRRIGRFLGQLQDAYPRLRVVAASRAEVAVTINGHKPDVLDVPEFDGDAAVEFLLERGVHNRSFAEDVASQLGGNPLTLKLAATAIGESQDEHLDDLRTRRFGIFRVKDEVVQGQLYYRVLGHVKDPEVEAIAQPALVLRRVTPEIISEVLQPALERKPDPEIAQALFDRMSLEPSLVHDPGDGSLRHRADVRRGVLRLLDEKNPDEVRGIENAAVAYYERRDGLVFGDDVATERAEEIYHRLRLGQDTNQVESRWIEGIQQHLWGVLEELPAKARVYLASRLGVKLDSDALKEASDSDWLQQTVAATRELLTSGDAGPALERIRERNVADPELALLEAWALAQLGKIADADAAVSRGIDLEGRRGDRENMISLLELGTELAEKGGRSDAAAAYLSDAITLMEAAGVDRSRLLRLELRRLRLGSGLEASDRESGTEPQRDELAAHFSGVADAELLDTPDLVREVAASVGGERPGVLARALRITPLSSLSVERRQDLAKALADAERIAGVAGAALLQRWARTFQIQPAGGEAAAWGEVLERAQDRGRLNDVVLRALDEAPEARDLCKSIAGALDDASQWTASHELPGDFLS